MDSQMTDAVAHAHDRLNQQDINGAIALLSAVVDTDDPEVAGLLGELLLEQGRSGEALPAFRRALMVQPENLACLRGVATALIREGEPAQAMAVCDEILSIRPYDATAHRYLARLKLAAGDRDAALEHAREARFLSPHDLDVAIDAALVLLDADEGLASVEMMDGALRHAHPSDPAVARANAALGRIWMGLGEPTKAMVALHAALEADPTDVAGATLVMAELSRNNATDHLPRAFVRALFDSYADRFERELVGKLRYDAPAALRQLLLSKGLTPDAGLRVLDTGCGTGLAGAAVRDLASHLAGFDIAPRMVEKARARGIYDTLWVGELVDSLLARPDAFDLILAADVLVYVGDLAPVMAAVATSLAGGGHFAFTCERGEGDGFLLHEGRRFAHGEAHIRKAVATAGMTLNHLVPFSARTDRGQPVPGWLAMVDRH
jgi:predicted TPR repeat methyltransferase